MGADALDAFVARIRKLGQLPADAARLAAPLIEAEVKATAAAGVTPDGKPWAPKRDGTRALVNAADAISAKAIGTSVVVTLKGPEVLHDKGTGHAPQRKVLPDGGAGLPKNVAAALQKATVQAFERTMGGG